MSRMSRTLACVAALLALAAGALSPSSLPAQRRPDTTIVKPGPKPERTAERGGRAGAARDTARGVAADSARPGSQIDTSVVRRISWRSIGPANQAGRVSVVTGVPGDPFTYYVAGANGGIFKTSNGGTTFDPVFDDQDVISIGAIALAPSNPDIVYVGTGEENPRNNASVGDGMYRSDDGGRSWRKIGLEKSDKIARIAIDPRDPDVVYACALGREWGPSEERGLFKTTDGGKSWKKILYIDRQTSCSDVDIEPANSTVVYAGMYTYRRWAWHLESGGGNTALYKSIDGGATWTKLSGPGNTHGLPRGAMDRIGISVSRSNPDVVYVVSETKGEGELWRTDDGGETWRTVSRDPNINFRPFYYADIRVDPGDPNRIFSLSGSLYLSEDGGKTFQRVGRDVHGDHQAMWIDPTNPKRVLSGSDGGFQVSYDGGRNWDVVNTVAFTQFYHIAYDMRTPYYVCGGLQDNGHWCGPSNSLREKGIRKRDWYTVSGGDGFFAVPDLERPWLIYTASQGGNIEVSDTRTGTERSIHPEPNRVGSAGDAMANHKYRFNWNSPIALSPQDPKTVYFGGNVLFKTQDFGQTWQVISPDLTTNDKSKQQSSGGPVVVDNTAAEFHSTLLSIAPSPKDPNVIWIGTDDGNVQVTRDGGKTWTNVIKNIQGLAPNAWIPTVDASASDAGTAYVAADHHQDDDYAPYAYKTTDYGKTWTRISDGLPRTGWVHVVREDPRNKNLLYAGTEFGIFASWDGGRTWRDIRGDLPPVPVRDLVVHPRDNDLILATHGRGAYIIDDVTPLQQRDEALASDAFLFPLRTAYRYEMWGDDGNVGQRDYQARNPPYGALVSYFLKTRARDSVTVVISDKSGAVVRTMRRLPRTAGFQRVAWDLRYDGPWQAPDSVRANRPTEADEAGDQPRRRRGPSGEAPDEFRRAPVGPLVAPGEYTVSLMTGGKTLTRTVRVEGDPRVPSSPEAYQGQVATGLQARDLLSRVNRTVARTENVMRQLSMLQAQLDPTAPPDPALADSAARDSVARGIARDRAGAADGGAMPASVRSDPNAAQVLKEARMALARLRSLRDDELTRPIPGLGYRQYPRLREEVQSLGNMITGPAAAVMGPTEAQKARLQELVGEVDRAAAKLDEILKRDVAHINELMSRSPRIMTEEVATGGTIP